ncbi:MAG: archaeal proteasome endopeptidase complex subunit alpha [Hadesarchaea archaeon]|nr:archaeal proteasome endopeptidase complex subunit alpha [Hadesarchaea archaeon]
MAFIPPGAGYDRAITVFSPDGKLFQVQYAQEAVKRGLTALGIKVKEGVVLAAERRIPSKLIEEESVEKILQVDEHIGIGASGLIADARALIDRARIEAQINRLRYGEPISVPTLARHLGDIKQLYTQHAGVRPFGARLLIGGISGVPHLFETDPSGVVSAWGAHAIGGEASAVNEVLERKYDRNMSLERAILLALEALQVVIGKKLKPERIEMAVIETKTKKYRKLSREEIAEQIKKLGSGTSARTTEE